MPITRPPYPDEFKRRMIKLVGPDAAPFLEWRASMTDEEWIDRNSL